MAGVEHLLTLITLRDTQANIEANSATLEQAAFAYASDVEKFGIYTNSAWVWFDNAYEVLMADGEATATPLANDEDSDWIYGD